MKVAWFHLEYRYEGKKQQKTNTEGITTGASVVLRSPYYVNKIPMC